ncbi:MAG: iron-sulfur cluster-binding domain-containing protein [Clostridia bacterium]|nr:iron-sulfur cluster-binding domain-containing protein [Clostridia bacterium]
MAKKLNIKVKPIGLLDLIAFKKLVPGRTKRFDEGSTTPLVAVPAVNRLAKQLHPKKQIMMIDEITTHNDRAKSFKLIMADGSKPAYFRAGQYVSLNLSIDGSVFTRPYSLSSSPKDALDGFYEITVKSGDGGFFSKWANENWKTGDRVEVSAPDGNFYYQPIRDEKTVVGICGGSGVTPFLSLAKSVAEGTENLRLILLYGSCKECDILFRDRLEEQERLSGGKVKVVHILSDDDKEGFEKGFITADLIKKYAPKEFSLFICGPQVMYNFLTKEIAKLKLSKKLVRRELFGEIKRVEQAEGYPDGAAGAIYKLRVSGAALDKEIEARSDESVLVAIERAGILAPSKCRSGECGYCRSRLVNGDVFVPGDSDGRRAADKKLGYIHPCASYPISDLHIQLPD